MKKVKLIAAVCVLALSLSSCYTSNVLNGNVTAKEPTVKVNSKKNHFLLWGLVPLSESQKASDFVGGKTNYVSQTSWTFVDGLLNCITFGIYTPTTTTYFVPLDESKR